MKEVRSYNIDDLVDAVGRYNHFKGEWMKAKNMLESKLKAIESFERDEAREKANMDRAAEAVLKIVKEL